MEKFFMFITLEQGILTMKKLSGFIFTVFLIVSFSACSLGFDSGNSKASESAQLDLIYDFRGAWDFSEDFLPLGLQYAITDLDGNGRLEVIGAINYNTGNFTHFEVYEVGEDYSRLNYLGSGVYTNFSMVYDNTTLATDICSPDVLPRQNTSKVSEMQVFTDNSGKRTYVFENYNGGLEENELIMEAFSLYNGYAKSEPIVYKVSYALSRSQFYDAGGNAISESQFENWKSSFNGHREGTATISWQSSITPDNIKHSYAQWKIY